jgi:hypothetical protein
MTCCTNASGGIRLALLRSLSRTVLRWVVHLYRRTVGRQDRHYTPFPDLPAIAEKGPRGWWLSLPDRPGMQRWIPPWAYRHLRFYGVGHIAGGSVLAAAGVVCLAYGVYGWAAFFLVLASLNLAGGSWYLTVDRSASSRA